MRLRVQRVVHDAEGRRQVFQRAEFAVGRTQGGALEFDVMLERRGRQQLDPSCW
jgi:hypothetical protein